jgi:hypothetical protein
MQKKFINNFFFIIKFFLSYPKKKLRILLFDYKYSISQFSIKKIQNQKKLLIYLINIDNYLLLENFIKTKKIGYLNDLFKNLTSPNFKKIILIYVYSYLVNINKYNLAYIYHSLLCKNIDQNSFFYFQVCTLNQKNISKFKTYSQTLSFKLIYFFLLYREEKNYVKTILELNREQKHKYFNLKKKDFEFNEVLKNKKIFIIGPLIGKFNLKKKDLKNSIIIRFKNNNFLKNSNFFPNIVYLNGTASRQYFENQNFLSKRQKLTWVVYVNESFYKIYKKKDKFKKRFINNSSAILFTSFTELNLLQKALLDLVRFKSKEIKLLNFNLKLTKKTQIGYGIHNTLSKQMRNKLTFNHNQIVMFDFIKFFYKKKITLLDNNLKKIIIGKKESYLKKLEQIWGK